MDNTAFIPKIKVTPNPPGHVSPQGHTRRLSDETIRINPEALNDNDLLKIPPQYTLLHKIGEGGMGVVYLAFEPALGRHVAIKCLKRNMSRRASFLKRFFREAKTIAALSDSRIVHIYALGEDPHAPFIVMEYVEGPGTSTDATLPAPPYTLTDKIADGGPLPIDQALSLLIKLCQAVSYAHSRGVIHRDLKPANILLNKSGEPKIVDFGLARRLNPSEEQLTRPGEKMLSMGYGAPEQETGAAAIDERADIYGLGAILFFCITGENPRYFRPNSVPEALRDVLVKALDTDRENRWLTARDFEQRLTLVHAPSSIEFPTTRTLWHCKWCQTTNPIVIRYCENCGWDGAEHCLECESETRIGIQFCGRCGADAREYEVVNLLLKKLQAKWDNKDYDFIVQHAGQASGFQPIGPSGQSIVEKIARLKKRAQNTLRQLEDIRKAIPHEVEQKNFIVVRKLIEDYDALARDRAFAETTRQLPAMILDRELSRARAALAKRDWTDAAHIARNALATLDPGHKDLRHIQRQARWMPWWLAWRNTVFALAGLVGLYLLSAAPVTRFTQGQSPALNTFFALASWVHEDSFMRRPLQRYSSLWGVGDVSDITVDADPFEPSPDVTAALEELNAMKARFSKTRLKLGTDQVREERRRSEAYLEKLAELQIELQEEGDFDGWLAVKSETDRFHDEYDLYEDALVDDPIQLRQAQVQEFEAILERKDHWLKETKRIWNDHITELEKLRKTLTQKGLMGAASQVNAEIRRLQSSPDYLEIFMNPE